MELITKRLIIRAPFLDDAEELADKINDISIIRWLTQVPYPYEISDAINFINRSNQFIANRTAFNLIIEMDGEIAGGAGLSDIKEKTCELGYWITPKFWNKGIATEASRAMLDFGFHDLDLDSIQASYKEGNEQSYRVLQKLGFFETFQESVDDEMMGKKITMFWLEINKSENE